MATRITGNALSLKFGTDEVKTQLGKFTLSNEEKDGGYKTFGDVDSPARQEFIEFEGIQSTDADSFWRFLYEHVGQTVSGTLAVHGNSSATDDQPIVTFTAKVKVRPDLGGEAGNDWTFEYRMDLVGESVLDDGS